MSLVIVVWQFLAVRGVCLQFVLVVFPDHTHLLFTVSNPPRVKHIRLLQDRVEVSRLVCVFTDCLSYFQVLKCNS